MPTVYYLNWDKEHRSEDNPEPGPASELFHKLTVKEVLDEDEQSSTRYSQDRFNQLYREIGEVDVDDPETVWKQWNRGSGYESREFLEMRERSMSVGDVLEVDGTYYQAQSLGWMEITVEGDAR